VPFSYQVGSDAVPINRVLSDFRVGWVGAGGGFAMAVVISSCGCGPGCLSLWAAF
jgi:hypothetical protein